MFKLTLTNIKPLTILTSLTVVLIITGLLSLIFIKYSRQPSPASPTPIPYNPSIPPLKGRELKQPPNFEKELEKIKKYLPYDSEGFRIEYRQTLKMVSVNILATNPDDFIKTRQKAENFIKSLGVQDLCTLNIFWMPSQDLIINKSLDPKETITTGCFPSVNPKS
ncbi:hypothetical protein HYU92_02275 [Candidatus Curtissbacteria bacterium]|nr:hypothetical protein [Candidatus Curtissbacteria bacterium]